MLTPGDNLPDAEERRFLRSRSFRLIVLIAAINCLVIFASLSAAPQPLLTTLEYKITGSQLRVTPAALSVPKGIAGSVLPQVVTGESTNGVVSSDLTQGGYIEATLRGPSFDARRLLGKPNEALLLPPLNLVGDYQLDNIRLVDAATGATRLEGVPSSVPVRVFDEVLVSRVVSRPLTVDEIRERGIVIDENNFRAVEFEVMFILDGANIPIRFPVVAPAFAQSTEIIPAAELEARLQQASIINQQIASQIAEVPPAFEAAGINLQVQGINFQIVEEADIDLALSIPSIPALMVIPGNIGFLSQFFSVQIFTENAAPLNSGLSVNHVMAKLNLPPGPDRVLSTNYNQPGDDPLRFARIGPDKIIQSTQQVVRPGPDGKVGTADDIPRLAPGESGQAEFLVEGLQEGLHVMDLDLTADLEGLAAGVVKIKGKAAGSVLVRNPKFSFAFSHPRTVRFGEPYEASVTVMNTGITPANLVRVTLHRTEIEGAIFEGDQAETIELGTIMPGETATATYKLRSQRTGAISFSNLTTGDDSVQGRFRLHMGVDERGVALSPDTIGMPDFVTNLPPTLVNTAVRMLGQALSAATAAQLPPGVQRVPRSVITLRVLELAEAGQRLHYRDGVNRVLPDLLLDWQGGRSYNAAFDQILRETGAGREWRAALMAAIEGADSFDATQRLENRAADLAGLGQAFVLVSGSDGRTTIVFGDGKQGAVPDSSTQPRAVVYDGARGDWGVTPFNSNAVVTWTFTNGSPTAELGALIVATNGTARQLRWTVTNPPSSAVYRYALADATGQLMVDVDGNGVAEAQLQPGMTSIAQSPLTLLAVEQDLTVNAGRPSDASRCIGPAWENYGTVVAVVFSRPVSQATAGDPASYLLKYGNGANSVQIQPSGRVALINLRQGISAIRPQELTLSGIMDTCGAQMADCTRAIRSVVPGTDPVVDFKDGVTLRGRVVRGNGSLATNVPVTLTMYDQAFNEFDANCESRAVRISQVFTDSKGEFEFEFVMAGIPYSVSATDTSDLSSDVVALILQAASRDDINRALLLQLANAPENQQTLLQAFAVAALPQAIAKVEGLDRAILRDMVPLGSSRQGQEVPMVLRFRGRATVTGQVVAEDGFTSVPGAAVNLFPDPDSREQGRGVFADSDGKFAFFGVPLGIFTVDVKTSDRRSRIVAGVLNVPSQVMNILVALPHMGERTERTTVRGRVIDPEGTNGQANARVYVGQYGGGNQVVNVAAIVTADATGFWDAPGVPVNIYDVVAVSFDGRRKGVRQGITTAANGVSFVNVTLESTAVVIGRVETSLGVAVSNAIVGGGEMLVRTDEQGRFQLTGVPLGPRTFSAGVERSRTNEPPKSNPAFAFPRLGSTSIDVVGGVTNFVTIRLNAAGRISGTVFDAAGQRVPGGRVAIPREGGFLWTEADTNGVYLFENLGLGSYTVSAPANAVFQTDTSGLIDQIRRGGEADILAAIQEAFNIFTGATDPFLTGEHLAFNPDTWGFVRANIRFDGDNPPADIHYLLPGTVAGKVLNHQGVPIGARVRLTGVGPLANGDVGFVIRGEVNSDPATGVFLFPGIVLEGSYGLQAASPFYPVVLTASGQIRQDQLLSTNILQFPAPPPRSPTGISIVATGWLAGVVLNPDGLPVGTGATVKIFGVSTNQTDTNGMFPASNAPPLALPVGTYRIEADNLGLNGQTYVTVQGDQTNRATVRLLGQGTLLIRVIRSTGGPATNAAVDLERGTYPAGRISSGLRTDADGQIQLQGLVEGSYAVCARANEGATDVFGRAGAVVATDSTNEVTVRLSATGIIEGRFVKRDRTNGIPDAQVAIGSIGYAPTREDGSFRIEGIPAGQHRLVTSDPVTGVGGVGTVIVLANQTNFVTLVEQSRGEISGRVLGSYRDRFVPGAEVVLSVSDGITPSRTVTTGPDGTFSFPGAPAGSFGVTATVTDYGLTLSGTAYGTLPDDTPSVTVEVAIEPLGVLPVVVLRSDGQTPATNVHLTLTGGLLSGARGTDTDAQGAVLFPNLRLGGPYSVSAVDNTNSRNAVRISAFVTVGGTNQANFVVLPGIGAIEGIVYDSSGTVPQRNLPVVLNIEAPLFAGTTVIHSSSDEGRFAFTDVPIGKFRLSVATNALFATFNGEIITNGQTTNVTLRLSDSGSIVGTLVRANGVTSVPGVDVVLNFSGSNGAFGVAVSRTDTDGTFRFDAIPVGSFAVEINAFGVGGLAKTNGIISFNGQVVDLGHLVLDEDFPSVVQVTPIPSATEVPTTTNVDLLFSEPLDVASLTPPAGIFLRAVGANANVPVNPSLLPDPADSRRVRLTPITHLISKQTYEVVVLRSDLVGPTGQLLARAPTDRVGRSLNALFLSRFTTADNDPPILLSMFPNTNAIQIDPRAVVRLAFNEPIRSSNFVATLTSTNRLVPGVASVGLNGLVLNFTPDSPLSPNTSYTLTVSDVFDLAGNRAAGEPFTNTFATLDTLGPVIAVLQVVSNSPVAGATVVIEARLTTNEPNATVRFIQDFDFLHTIGYATNAPFQANVRLPTSGTTTIHAIATDRFGNDGPLATNAIEVVSNGPPTVVLTRANPASGPLTNGQPFSITVIAMDDAGVTNIFVVGAGPGFLLTTNFNSESARSITSTITSTVPENMVPGSQISFSARAIDDIGLPSQVQSLSYAIVDGAPPVVEILYPTNNALLTSNMLQLVIAGSDNSGLHTLQLNLSGAVVAAETLIVTAAPNAVVTNRFTNSLASALDDGTPLRLILRATDAAGLFSVVTQTLAIASPPRIVLQPQGRHAGVGSNVTFVVNAFGTAQLFYQWNKDGTILLNATNDTLRLEAVTGADVGLYSVVISNAFGVTTSSNALLSLSGDPPSISIQPQSVLSGVGATVRFSAQAVAQEGAHYQWVFFGTNLTDEATLPGAISPLLTLTNAGSANVGVYQLRVTDDFGMTNSDRAWLILSNNVDGLPLNSAVAMPPVTILLVRADPPGLALNTTVAQPPVSLALLGVDNTGGLSLNTTVGQPPVSLFLLGTDNTGGLGLNTTFAQPTAELFLLGAENSGGLALNTTIGQPTATLFLLGTDNTGGLALNTTVAQPPAEVFLLGTDNTGGLLLNTTLAQPPVMLVTNGAPGFAAQAQVLNGGSLSLSSDSRDLWIRWTGSGAVLQSSTNLDVWVDLLGTASPYRVPENRRASEFFRLRYPIENKR